MQLGGAATPTASGPAPGDLIGGKYRVTRVLGRGGMGQVLAATHEATGKNVALKWVLDPSSEGAAARFAREARAAGRIHHPNVVDVYDVIEHEGAACMVMEMLRGESLSAALAREKRLPVADVIRIGLEIARGIEAAHAQGVIHRDLKPANLFLCDAPSDARVKIVDFGISKIVNASPDSGPDLAPLTHTGVVLGTPQYLAPEQVRGAKDADHRVDVYAIGAVLYEMLAGRPPHQHEHFPALLVEIATVAPLPIELVRPDVPSELAEIVGRAIAKEPDARFPTAQALADALAELDTPTSGEKRVPTSGEKRVPSSGEQRVRGVAATESAEVLAPTLDAPITPRPSNEATTTRARVGELAPRAEPPRRTRAVVLAIASVAIAAALATVLWSGGEETPAVAHETIAAPAPEPVATTAPIPTPTTPEVRAPEAETAAEPTPMRPRVAVRRPVPLVIAPVATPIAEPVVAPVTVDPAPTHEPRAGRLGLDDL